MSSKFDVETTCFGYSVQMIVFLQSPIRKISSASNTLNFKGSWFKNVLSIFKISEFLNFAKLISGSRRFGLTNRACASLNKSQGTNYQLPIHPTEATCQQPMEGRRSSNYLVASVLQDVAVLKQKNVERGKTLPYDGNSKDWHSLP